MTHYSSSEGELSDKLVTDGHSEFSKLICFNIQHVTCYVEPFNAYCPPYLVHWQYW